MTGGAAGNSWMFGDRGRRMVQSMQGDAIEVKSRVNIFIKDLGIVLDEAKRVQANHNISTTPIAQAAFDTFRQAVNLGLEHDDDSSLWKVYSTITAPITDEKLIFDDKNVVEVGSEPKHKVKLHNKYCRALLVSFPAGTCTLPHTHAEDSVYLFLNPSGCKIRNHIKGGGCCSDFTEFGEVRWGTHRNNPLTHMIYAEACGAGVFVVDAEVLAPPPKIYTTSSSVPGELVIVPEIEVLERHEVIKIRDKIRVFKLSLLPNESIALNYEFYYLLVVCTGSEIMLTVPGTDRSTNCNQRIMTETREAGDMLWGIPGGDEGLVWKNVGTTAYTHFIVQWRNF